MPLSYILLKYDIMCQTKRNSKTIFLFNINQKHTQYTH